MNEIEGTGAKFDLAKFMAARALCIDITQEIANKVTVGMSEADGQALVKEEFKKHGITKFWHPTKFRMGPDTTKSFREPPDKTLLVGKNDIFFLDLGPVIDDHEADYGQTYFMDETGHVSDRGYWPDLVQRVWNQVAQEWKTTGATGKDLLRKAQEFAVENGCQLNPSMAGHRLGDFPHALFSKASLYSLGFRPSENLWVLEVHLLSADSQRAGFFEDILQTGSRSHF